MTRREVRKEIADSMYKRRKNAGLTQMELAKKWKISQATISKMERGKLEPSLSEWLAFCEITKTDIHPF